MAISKEDILEAIGSMSVLDLSELIKEMEDHTFWLEHRYKLNELSAIETY